MRPALLTPRRLASMIFLAFGFVALHDRPAAAGTTKTLAVAYFENRSEQAQWQPLAKGLADMLVTDLAGTEGLTVVERDRLQAVLAEIELAKTKFIDPKTARKLGKGLGASHVLVGAFQVLGGKLRVDARAVDVESGAVTFAAEQTGTAEDVFDVEQALAAKLRTGLGLEPRKTKVTTPRVSVDDLRTYGSGLDALDDGRLDEARRILSSLASGRPDFTLARRGLDRLSQRIHDLLTASNLAPERVVALARELAAGKTDACTPLLTELGSMQSTTTRASTAILVPDGSSRADLAKTLAAHYAATLMLLETPPLAAPLCPGDQAPAATGLAYFFFALHMAAKQVMDCHPAELAQSPNRAVRTTQCERILERVPALEDGQGHVVVAAADYPALMVQLGELAIDRFPKSPFTPGMLPILRTYVEHAKLVSLGGAEFERAIGEAKATNARTEFARATAYADLALVDVRIPLGDRERASLPGAGARLVLLLGEGTLALGLDRIELSVDGGVTFPHTWPLNTDAPGFAAPHLKLDVSPNGKTLVGLVERRTKGREGPAAIDIGAARWFRTTAWLGDAWTSSELAKLRFRLVALDGSVLGKCGVSLDADTTERTRNAWLVARSACRGP